MANRSVQALVDDIYAASLDPDRWSAVAARLASFLNAPSSVIQLRGADGVLFLGATANMHAEAMQAYAKSFSNIDPWAEGWRRRGSEMGRVFFGSELSNPEALEDSEFYQDYAVSLEQFHFIGSALQAGPRAAVLIAAHRPMTSTEFTIVDKDKINQILPHIRRAIQIQLSIARAELQEGSMSQALDRLVLGVMLVDGDGRVSFANKIAERLLREGDGLAIRHGKVYARDSRASALMMAAIGKAASIAQGKLADAPGVMFFPRLNRRALSAMTVPLSMKRQPMLLAAAVAMIFVADPDAAGPPNLEALIALHQITPAEARLLRALIAGERISDYAARAEISVNTALTQLKQLFAKTGTNRQSDLVRFVLSDVIATLR
jgi:DNA-binding CsgD family transcriptional regulator/PAS domain-containing protein